MKLKLLLSKSLLVVALLSMGGNGVWAYDVPSGYEVKNVFFGTDNGDNTVTAEDFATTTATGWSLIGFSSDANNSVGISTITEVAKPEIGSAPEGVPTYVTGKCIDLKARDRQSAIKYTGYSFASVSSGYLVFDADIFGDGNYPSYVKFVDSEGNAVLTMHWKDGNTDNSRAFRYQIGTADEVDTSLGGKPRTYHGYGIRDLVINLGTGATSFKLDYITFAGVRALSSAVELNIGTGKNIAGIQLGYVFNSGASNETRHSYIDNIKLYTVGVESPSYTYTIKAKAGSTDLGTLATGSCKGGMSFSATGLPYVIKNDGKYFVLTDAAVSNFMKSYTMENDGSNKDPEIEYTLDNTIVFYSETEDLGNHGGESAGNYSNGKNAYISGGKYSELGEFSRGVYSVSAGVNDRPDRGMIIRSAQSTATGNQLAYVTSATSGIMNGEFSLYAATTIYLSGITTDKGINQSATMDYIIIRKTADIPVTVTASIGEYGYATFCSEYALDFTSVSNATAWVATNVADGKVTLTQVEGDIYQGKGLILKSNSGGAAEVSIPVVASSTNYYDDNKMVACLAETTVNKANDGTCYVLSVQGTAPDETVVFAPIGDTSATVNAGQCYMWDSGTGARSLSFVFGEETTGISDATRLKSNDESIKNGEVYNLNGQLVAAPSNGIYIVDGKKVIIK